MIGNRHSKKGLVIWGTACMALCAVLGCESVYQDPSHQNKPPVFHNYDDRLNYWCQRSIYCLDSPDFDFSDCKRLWGGMYLSDDCMLATANASCGEVNDPESDYSRACWDTCQGDYRTCLGDDYHDCFQTNLFVFNCTLLCFYSYQAEYSGTCSEFSPTGLTRSPYPICWCNVD